MIIQVQIWRCDYCWTKRKYGYADWEKSVRPVLRCKDCLGNTLHHFFELEWIKWDFDPPREVERWQFVVQPLVRGEVLA